MSPELAFSLANSGQSNWGCCREVVPNAAMVAILVNPSNPLTEGSYEGCAAGGRNDRPSHSYRQCQQRKRFGPAFAAIAELHAGALIIGGDPFFFSRSDRLVALAARHAIPAIYELREFAVAGGLISYGVNLADGYRRPAPMPGVFSRAPSRADLPVLQPTKFELVINLKTAKALGLDVPLHLAARADEVIE